MEYELTTNIPNSGRASIRQNAGGNSWTWYASYSDGSGTESNWCPTKRGAMICAINGWRHFSKHYGKAKFKWALKTPANAPKMPLQPSQEGKEV